MTRVYKISFVENGDWTFHETDSVEEMLTVVRYGTLVSNEIKVVVMKE